MSGARKTGRNRSYHHRITRIPAGFALRRRILIVGEGQESEPNYFHGLNVEDAVRKRFTVQIYAGHGRDQVSVVQEAIQRMGAGRAAGRAGPL